jgi:predicted DNA-binding transcriptional regulator AlpA
MERLKMHKPKRYLTTRKLMVREGVSQRTIDRRVKDPDLEYPQPDMIKGRRYWDEEKIEAWEANQAAAGNVILNERCARCSAACTDDRPWFDNTTPCFVCPECALIVGAAILGEVVGIEGDDDEEWPLSAVALERNNNAHAARQRQYRKNRKLESAS